MITNCPCFFNTKKSLIVNLKSGGIMRKIPANIHKRDKNGNQPVAQLITRPSMMAIKIYIFLTISYKPNMKYTEHRQQTK